MRFDLEGLEDLALSLSEIAEIPDDIQAQILNTQADDFVREVKNRGAGYGVGVKKGTGQLLKSIKKGKIRRLNNGLAIYVQPTGSRKRGKIKTKNTEIGFFVNYGSRHNRPLPFWTDSVAMYEGKAEKKSREIFDNWLKSKNL